MNEVGKTMPQTRWLRRLKVNRIDLVDEGAQPDAMIPLYKRHDVEKVVDIESYEGRVALITQAFLREHGGYENESGEYAGLCVAAIHDGYLIAEDMDFGSLHRYGYVIESTPAGMGVSFSEPAPVSIEYVAATEVAVTTKDGYMTLVDVIESLDDEARKMVEDALSASAVDAAEKIAEALAAVEVEKARAIAAEEALVTKIADIEVDEEADNFDEVYKNLPESVRKRIEAADEAVSAANAEIAKMRDEQSLAESVAKARVDYPSLGGAEELGGLLSRIAKSISAEDFAEMERTLKAASARIESGVIFSEMGSSGEVSDALASEIAKNKALGLSKAAATEKALSENPHLYV